MIPKLSYAKHKDTLDDDSPDFDFLSQPPQTNSSDYDDCSAAKMPILQANRHCRASPDHYRDGKPRPVFRGARHGAVACISFALLVLAAAFRVTRG